MHQTSQPSGGLDKALKLLTVLMRKKRMSVRGIQKEIGLPRSNIYHYVKAIAPYLDIRVHNGVVTLDMPGMLGAADSEVAKRCKIRVQVHPAKDDGDPDTTRMTVFVNETRRKTFTIHQDRLEEIKELFEFDPKKITLAHWITRFLPVFANAVVDESLGPCPRDEEALKAFVEDIRSAAVDDMMWLVGGIFNTSFVDVPTAVSQANTDSDNTNPQLTGE